MQSARVLGLFLVPACLASLLALGCDEKNSKTEPSASAKATASAAPTTPPEPPKPTNTYLSVSDDALSINGSRIEFQARDAQTRMVLELTGKPKIEGENVTVEVARATKAPKVGMVLWALRGAKAASLTIRTPKRDGVTADVAFGFQKDAPGCSATAFIANDISTSVWPVSGQVAKRFAKGMAGPDLTMASDAFRKASASCDSPIAYVAGDENITWGLVFDLALAAKEGSDAGAFRAQKFGIPAEAPVAGRKVTTEPK